VIDDAEERARLAPAAACLREAGIPFSIDTWSPATARAALRWGAGWINFTGQDAPAELLEDVARSGAGLVLTYMPHGDAYQMRRRARTAPPPDLVREIIAFLRPRVEAARAAGIDELIVDPNLGILHPETDDYEKIHRQLEIVWESHRLRTLGCPLLFYAARKPERLARIMMASAVLHARPEYVRTHEPGILRELLRVAGPGRA
jgi:dihydropteroate synthase